PVTGHGLVEAQHEEPAADEHPDLVVERAALRPEVPGSRGLAAEQGAVEGAQPADPDRALMTQEAVSGPRRRVAAGRLLDLASRGGGEREGRVVVEAHL